VLLYGIIAIRCQVIFLKISPGSLLGWQDLSPADFGKLIPNAGRFFIFFFNNCRPQ
jgi:hypothetical protein